MRGGQFADDVARRLATPAGRRSVLAGVGAAVAASTPSRASAQDSGGGAGVPGGGTLMPPKRPKGGWRPCRKDTDCRFGKSCQGGHCKPAIGFVKRGGWCRQQLDCDTSAGPVNCRKHTGGCPGVPQKDKRIAGVCVGTWSPYSLPVHPACTRDCECDTGLTCQDGACWTAPASLDRNHRCEFTRDCATDDGPVVCEQSDRCGDGIIPEDAFASFCMGGYDSASDIGGTCAKSCECAAGLTCQNQRCRPAPVS